MKWKLLNNPVHIKALYEARVQTDGLRSSGIWVPEWALRAIKLHESGEYADLTLVEFLLKVKPLS